MPYGESLYAEAWYIILAYSWPKVNHNAEIKGCIKLMYKNKTKIIFVVKSVVILGHYLEKEINEIDQF